MTKEQQFEQFWTAYPNKKGKADARKAFEKAIKETTLEIMLAAIKAYIANKPDWQAFKHPGTWLRAGCWDDEWEQRSPLSSFAPGRYQTREEYLAAEQRRANRSFQH